MKRFMLVSLMSCMLVGQVSCVWNWSDYGKGLLTALGHTGITVGVGAIAGAAFGCIAGEKNRKEFFLNAACGAGILGAVGAMATAAAAVDVRDSGGMGESELSGRRTPFMACTISTFAALVGYGFYTAYQPPAC